ncbi:uncharacterized protein LOC128531344 [Clarias gariepinus]|uniref:uncharacterized protein LOC128531344 n=1 Tax=Clarias gariepinus TaxID=13013 RepID=UPI00234CCB21|nr:uncharacterized protein LOC128531344 [Clarias gariepinus]
MTGLWILVLFITILYIIHSGWCQVTAQSLKIKVYQPDKELSVDVGNQARLQCCDFEQNNGEIIWFKQQNSKLSQIMVRSFQTGGEKFYNEFQNSRFQIKKLGNCLNLTISNITLSDEAIYYCALMFPAGTYLKITGEHGTIASETSEPTLCDKSVGGETALRENTTNMNIQKKTVLGLGTALGFCALLIFCLTYFILWRRKKNAFVKDSPEISQKSDDETLNYSALQFTKRKAKADKKKTDLSEECVYSGVK